MVRSNQAGPGLSFIDLRICTVATVLLSLASFYSFALDADSTNSIRFESKEDHFAVTLPIGWKEMEPELAGAFVDRARLPKPGEIKAYGYELASAKGLMETPVVVVQVLRLARIPERFLGVLSNKELRRKAVCDMLKREGVLERDILDTGYNTNRQLLRMSIIKVDPHAGRLRALNGILFTDTGSINILCLAKAEEFAAWSGPFDKILESFYIDPAIRYRPRAAEAIAAQSRARESYFLIITIAPPLIGLIYFFCRRYADTVRSDEI